MKGNRDSAPKSLLFKPGLGSLQTTIRIGPDLCQEYSDEPFLVEGPCLCFSPNIADSKTFRTGVSWDFVVVVVCFKREHLATCEVADFGFFSPRIWLVLAFFGQPEKTIHILSYKQQWVLSATISATMPRSVLRFWGWDERLECPTNFKWLPLYKMSMWERFFGSTPPSSCRRGAQMLVVLYVVVIIFCKEVFLQRTIVQINHVSRSHQSSKLWKGVCILVNATVTICA